MLKRIEAVGWPFFMVLFVLLIPPFIYMFFGMQGEQAHPMGPWGAGTLLAMFVAGVLTWLVNSLLRLYHDRQDSGEE